MTTPPDYPLVQVAYFVDNAETAALRFHRTFGAGPFFLVPNITLRSATHRGEPCPFVHTSAYGQWGNLMLELVQQDSDGPSPFRDLFAPGQSGLHHMATMVPDQQAAYAAYRAAGFEIATVAVTENGTEFAFVDTCASLGHFIEVYAASEALTGFYQMVRDAADGWRGSNPIRSL